MFLSEIFDNLTHGELAQVSLSGGKNKGIQEADYPKIIGFVNLAMIELYKKFPIKLGTMDVQLYADITRYLLRYDYALSNTGGAEPVKYILDSASDPFTQDVLHIERISNLDLVDIPVNKLNNTLSVFTPEYDIFTIAEPDATDIYTIEYRAAPEKIDQFTTDPYTAYVNLPDQMMEAMLSYVAHRAFSALPTPEPSNSASFYTKFLAACRNIQELGLINKMETENTRLDEKGFV